MVAPPRAVTGSTDLLSLDLDADVPADMREACSEHLDASYAVAQWRRCLRCPRVVDRLQRGNWRRRPIVVDLRLRELCQENRDPGKILRVPDHAFQRLQQPDALWSIHPRAGCGCETLEDDRIGTFQIVFNKREELVWSRFSVQR